MGENFNGFNLEKRKEFFTKEDASLEVEELEPDNGKGEILAASVSVRDGKISVLRGEPKVKTFNGKEGDERYPEFNKLNDLPKKTPIMKAHGNKISGHDNLKTRPASKEIRENRDLHRKILKKV